MDAGDSPIERATVLKRRWKPPFAWKRQGMTQEHLYLDHILQISGQSQGDILALDHILLNLP